MCWTLSYLLVKFIFSNGSYIGGLGDPYVHSKQWRLCPQNENLHALQSPCRHSSLCLVHTPVVAWVRTVLAVLFRMIVFVILPKIFHSTDRRFVCEFLVCKTRNNVLLDPRVFSSKIRLKQPRVEPGDKTVWQHHQVLGRATPPGPTDLRGAARPLSQ